MSEGISATECLTAFLPAIVVPMRRTLAVATLALLVTGCTTVGGDGPSPTTAAQIGGVWQGNLTENTGSGFSVKVTIDDPLTEGQQGALAQYRGIGGPRGCSGDWVYTGQKEGSWVFTETITSGSGDGCDTPGTVTLTPAQNETLQYFWKDDSGDNSYGYLSRP